MGRFLRWGWRFAALTVVTFGASGCTAAQWGRGGWPAPITVQGHRILAFWQAALLAALCVGGFVGGLIVYSCFRFRKRTDELPRQVRYNIPVEVLYTVVPMIIVAFLFYFTAKNETYEDKLSAHPDVSIEVVGFQWSWQFDYVGQNLQVTGRPGDPPTLVLPVGKTVQFTLRSPDVIHAFWVIPFLFKRDVLPGHPNRFEVTLDKVGGPYMGRCVEFCGVDHDRMIFYVRSVTYAQWLAYLANGRALARSGTNPMYSSITGGPA